jgi:hypothetical protein
MPVKNMIWPPIVDFPASGKNETRALSAWPSSHRRIHIGIRINVTREEREGEEREEREMVWQT